MLIRKISTFIKALYGVIIRIRYSFYNYRYYSLPSENKGPDSVTVSLTSYGRRVKSTLPFVLISLLRQTRKPDRIVVWLDHSWNNNNLPKNLIVFKNNGVVFRFCEDYKSFKKLIPSLQEYPNDIIITCDDDLFYNKHMVERLLDAHKKHPNTICCQLAHGINYNGKKLQSYNQWEEEVFDTHENVFPLGGSGCLYKAEYLYKDVVNYELASRLTPKADDVWFYFMGVLNGTKRYVLPHIKDIVIPLDVFYQFFNRGSSLMDDNLAQGLNDKQIKAIMDYYSIDIKIMCGYENYSNNSVL